MKKYELKDLEELIGKPVYVKVIDENSHYKSGWAVLYKNENINAYYAKSKDEYPISAYFNKTFELYDTEN